MFQHIRHDTRREARKGFAHDDKTIQTTLGMEFTKEMRRITRCILLLERRAVLDSGALIRTVWLDTPMISHCHITAATPPSPGKSIEKLVPVFPLDDCSRGAEIAS